MNPKHNWSEDDIAYLREHFPMEAGCDIAERLGVSVTLVYNKARELGLKKSKSYDRRVYNNRYVRKYSHVS